MKRLVLLASFVLPTLIAPFAKAYLIDSRAVFRLVAERQATARVPSGTVRGNAWLAATSGNPVRDVPVEVALTFPGQCRSQLTLPEGVSTATYASGKVAEEGNAVAPLAAFATLGCPLLAMKNVPAGDAEAALSRLASRLGIDLGTVSLSILDRRPAYVVGAHPREGDKPQLWFDLETLQPLRVIGRAGGQLWDVRFDEPGSLATNRRAPARISVFRGSEQQLRLERLETPVPEGVTTGPAASEGDEEQE